MRRLGVPLDPARRRRWQRLGLFPLPVRGAEHRAPGAAYHHRAPLLAVFLHRAIGPDPSRAAPDAVHEARNMVALLRLRAAHLNGSLAGEERFYALLGEVLRGAARRRQRSNADPPAAPDVRRPVASAPPSLPRWVTTRGTLSAAELEAACRVRGVRLDRARRTYWQSERAFPQPERRHLRPPEGNGGARGYYHAGAVALALVVDYAVRHDHPSKSRPWRCTVADVAHALAEWRAAAQDEDGFYRRIQAELLSLVGAGAPLPGMAGRHRDVLPVESPRIPRSERRDVLEETGRAAAALADAWVAGHGYEPTPDRLVVWLRVERGGAGEWRIADAGARPTSHERRRRSAETRPRTPPELTLTEHPLASS